MLIFFINKIFGFLCVKIRLGFDHLLLDYINQKESLIINEIISLKLRLQENQNNIGTNQKSTKSVFLNKLSKKSENKQTPLNIKANSNKSRNIGLKEIG